MRNFSGLQAYKGMETDSNTRHMSMGSWHADLKKQGARRIRSAGSPGAKKLGKERVCYPPATGWKGGSVEQNMGFSSPQKGEEE